MRGEFYAFQIGVYAVAEPIADLNVRFERLARARRRGDSRHRGHLLQPRRRGLDGKAVPQAGAGRARHGPGDLVRRAGAEDAAPGRVRGNVTVAPAGEAPTAVPVTSTSRPRSSPDHGDDDPWRLSRLRWLDSPIALDDELVAPYTPVTRRGRHARRARAGRVTLEAWASRAHRELVRDRDDAPGRHAPRRAAPGPWRSSWRARTDAPWPWPEPDGDGHASGRRASSAGSATAAAGPIRLARARRSSSTA